MQLQVAFYKGRARRFNRLVSWYTRGPYSHCELVVQQLNAGALCWSSSFMDGGVRLKVIQLDPAHWDLVTLEVSEATAAAATQWFKEHEGQGYDVQGLLGFVWRRMADDQRRWFCNEAVGAALGIPEAWRFDPNSLWSALVFRRQTAELISIGSKS